MVNMNQITGLIRLLTRDEILQLINPFNFTSRKYRHTLSAYDSESEVKIDMNDEAFALITKIAVVGNTADKENLEYLVNSSTASDKFGINIENSAGKPMFKGTVDIFSVNDLHLSDYFSGILLDYKVDYLSQISGKGLVSSTFTYPVTIDVELFGYLIDEKVFNSFLEKYPSVKSRLGI